MSNVAVALVEIRESRKTAIFDFLLVVPVIDVTIGMVVRSLIEGIDPSIVVFDRCYMIGNDVNHDPDPHRVSSVYKLL